MRILELRFKNLNSLYGEWIIDFTDPEYISNGLFALTGPTGAGKSTILDAICLAMYGATPRLGRITESGNEIMSRQTGECYAEVLFESQAGQYRCHWEQRRAYKKADGRLQDQEHQVSEADTGKPVETKKSRVPKAIEEKTGMDFDRFTRSILLAQGGFDTFLKANIEQKSKILEQITGTEVYSLISRQVHERRREEQDKLNLLKAQIQGIEILEPEQEIQIQQALEAKQKEETGHTAELTGMAKAMEWLTLIDGLKQEISSLTREASRLKAGMDAFRPEREKLDRAVKAAVLDGDYATLLALRKQQSDDQEALNDLETSLPGFERATADQAKVLAHSEQQTVKARGELKALAPLLLKVRALDQRLAEQKKTVLEGEKSCTKDKTAIESFVKARQKEEARQSKIGKMLAQAGEYLSAHSRDEWLVSGLAGVEAQLANLQARQKERDQKEKAKRQAAQVLEQSAQKLEESSELVSRRQQVLAQVKKDLLQGRATLSELLAGRLLREYRAQKDALLREMAFLARISELEEHRARLEDGKPCPLCGAADHPFAAGNVPVPDETEKKIEALSQVIRNAEDQETVIRNLEVDEANALQRLTDSEKLKTEAENGIKHAEKTLADLNEGIETTHQAIIELKRGASETLHPLGIEQIPDHVSSLIRRLRERLEAWLSKVKEKAELETQMFGIGSELKRLEAVIDTRNNALRQAQERLEQLKGEYTAGNGERKAMYGDKDPDDEERRLNQAVAHAEGAEKQAQKRHQELLEELNRVKTQAVSLKQRITRRTTELEASEAVFSEKRHATGFPTEAQFLDARMAPDKKDALSRKARSLDTAQTELSARRKDHEEKLSKETARNVTDHLLAELESRFKEKEALIKDLRDSIAGLNHRLQENRAAKERVKQRQADIEAQKKECQRWESLHALIGSADGKKYRNFAQGLTFELMVSHANRQLSKMTDRYLLIRDEQQPLELNVIDNYQAGEIRSTRNLSGGESFIVSLTLALGLSRMASRKVRVDSLFLDEGFGTLDEDALETALETLAGLQKGGKLIGIISHVPALKERISSQIAITPLSGGKSAIVGPGCSRVTGSG